jgi:pimeloyl-ACP methyl ester carboxylesterase
MGGNAGLAVGITVPDRCLSIMMGGTQPFARDERLSQLDLPTPIPFAGMPDGPNRIDQLLAQGGETWVAFYEGNMVVSSGMKRRLMANDFEALRARFQGLHQKNIAQYLGPVQMPCLVFVGEDEAAYGGAKQLADLLSHAKFVAYPGLNHFDMFTSIDVVLPNILHFLDNNT